MKALSKSDIHLNHWIHHTFTKDWATQNVVKGNTAFIFLQRLNTFFFRKDDVTFFSLTFFFRSRLSSFIKEHK